MTIDHEILVFLWRWKLVSSTGLAGRFFPNLTSQGVNWHLLGLQKHNLIYPYNVNSKEAKVLWGLTVKGFKLAKQSLPALVEDGFRSEHQIHDFFVTAFHLGDWLNQVPRECDVFSEQELRRYNVEQYPEWVPKTTIHRPDGYWLVSLPAGLGTIALEVELKLKTPNFYEVVAKFYRDQPEIFRVVWLVASESNGKSIRDRLQKGSPHNIGIHNFVLKEDFLKMGWQAPIRFGSQTGNSVSFLLGDRDQQTTKKVWSFAVLDTRKSPRISELYAQFPNLPFSALGGHTQSITPPHTNSISDRCSLPPSNNPISKTTGTRRKET